MTPTCRKAGPCSCRLPYRSLQSGTQSFPLKYNPYDRALKAEQKSPAVAGGAINTAITLSYFQPNLTEAMIDWSVRSFTSKDLLYPSVISASFPAL